MLARRVARRREQATVAPVIDTEQLRALQAGVERVEVDADIMRYCVDLAAATRAHPAVEVGASPRGSLALLLVARALAVLDGRGYVVPDDVKGIAVPALAHRLTLRARDLDQRHHRRRGGRRVAGPGARPPRRAGDRRHGDGGSPRRPMTAA